MRHKSNLTAREITILELLVNGITTSAAIGRQLGLSERFVSTSISRLMGKFEARNRTELAVRWWAKRQRDDTLFRS